jgi:hypothetical protein
LGLHPVAKAHDLGIAKDAIQRPAITELHVPQDEPFGCRHDHMFHAVLKRQRGSLMIGASRLLCSLFPGILWAAQQHSSTAAQQHSSNGQIMCPHA